MAEVDAPQLVDYLQPLVRQVLVLDLEFGEGVGGRRVGCTADRVCKKALHKCTAQV